MSTPSRLLFFGFASFVATLGIEKQRETRQAGRQGRQGFGKGDTPSSKGKQEGRQAEKGEGRRTHHPTKGNKKIKKKDELGDKLDDKMGNKLGDKRGDKLGDKMRHKLGDNGEKASRRRTQHKGKQEGRRAGRQAGRQGLEKVDTPSNKDQQEGVQGETRGGKTLGHGSGSWGGLYTRSLSLQMSPGHETRIDALPIRMADFSKPPILAICNKTKNSEVQPGLAIC